jgi:hypothetical protein
MPRKLKPEETALLHAVLERWAPERTDLRTAFDQNSLTPGQRTELCELITKEFVASGLGADNEPTPRGLLLEGLLDAVNRPNLKPNDN